MPKRKYAKESFLDSLQKISDLTKENDEIEMRQITSILSGKGYSALLIIFSLPFCIPIQIPGFSTPFGIILGFLGLRIAFAKKPWWPQWVLEKKVKSHLVQRVVEKSIVSVRYIQKFLYPRLVILTQNQFFYRLNGLLICFLAFLLALPLPIPFTNLFSAIPILFIGLGLLENDGLFILLAYFIVLIDIILILSLFKFGSIILTFVV